MVSATVPSRTRDTRRKRIDELKAAAAHHRQVARGHDERRDFVAANRELDKAFTIERELRQASAEDAELPIFFAHLIGRSVPGAERLESVRELEAPALSEARIEARRIAETKSAGEDGPRWHVEAISDHDGMIHDPEAL